MALSPARIPRSVQRPRIKNTSRPGGISKPLTRTKLRKSTRLSRKTAEGSIQELASVSGEQEIHNDNQVYKRKRDDLEDHSGNQPSKRQHKSSGSAEDSCPTHKSIEYWRRSGQWPKDLFEPHPMAHLLARKKSSSSIGRKRSIDGITVSSKIADEKTREEKSAPYKDSRYEERLQLKGFYMTDHQLGLKPTSEAAYKLLQKRRTTTPKNSPFSDDIFIKTCRNMHGRNEARVISDVRLLLVPSAEALSAKGEISIQDLIESVDEGWNQTNPITPVRPQPDFSVGYRRDAFTEEQLNKIRPILGDSQTQVSYFRATWYMYFPFLTCEVKCGTAALDIADRQNAHSAGIAVRAVFELFRLAKREAEVNRTILAFSVSHDNMSVRIHGYYPVLNKGKVTYHRHEIDMFNFQARDGTEKWTAYKFIKSVYDHWAPAHLRRIRAVLDNLPVDVTSLGSSSSQHTGLSQQAEGLSQISTAEDQSVKSDAGRRTPLKNISSNTPETSVSNPDRTGRLELCY